MQRNGEANERFFVCLFFFNSELKLFVLHVPHCPQSTYKAKCLAKLSFAAYLRNSILHTAKHTMIKFSLIGDPFASFLPLWIFFYLHLMATFSFSFFSIAFLIWWLVHWIATTRLYQITVFNKTIVTIPHLKPLPITNKLAPNKSFVWLVKEGGKFARNKRLRLPGWWNLVN